ncbi:MAG: hypothetical protein HY696_04780 [Deltaproteobacteria bacterium]|nr:hypothetical protein [Deltaproteobacteria bacterium]
MSPAQRRLFNQAQGSPYLSDLPLGARVEVERRQWWGGTSSVEGYLVLVGWDGCTVATPTGTTLRDAVIHYRQIATVTVLEEPAASRSDWDQSASNAQSACAAKARQQRLQYLAQFQAWNGWAEIAPAVSAELAVFRQWRGQPARRQYLQQVGGEILARIGPRQIGWHYNLHGGGVVQYMEAGGIRATRGDIAAIDSMRVPPEQVYFFSSPQLSLDRILDERNPGTLFGNTRMGTVLIPFDLHADCLEAARRAGIIADETEISLTFDADAAARQRASLGIPAEAFLTPPLTVFEQVATRLGLPRLSRDEETLAVMRYIEAAFAWTHNHPPSARQ